MVVKKLLVCLMVFLSCAAQQTYKDAYVSHYTDAGFTVRSHKLTTFLLLKKTFSLQDGAAFQDMLLLINQLLPDHDYTIIMEDSSSGSLDVYKGRPSVASKKQETCIFCDIIKGAGSGVILGQNQSAIALAKQYITSTCLIIPKTHIVNIKDLKTDIDYSSLFADMLTLAYAHACYKQYRLVINNGCGSAQSVFHMHWHITPLCVYSK